MDGGKLLLLLGAAALVTLMALRGWRLGLVRQACSIVAVGLAYVAGWLGGSILIPVLRPLGFPDRILTGIGSAVLGLLVFTAITVIAGILFKRTAQQSVTVVRLGFGIAGAVLGAAFGLLLVLVCAVAIRVLGSIAESESKVSELPPRPVVARLAGLKHALEEGATGAVMERIDPVPARTYDVLSKAGRIVADPESLERFASTPGLRSLHTHPKILALRDDPEIARAVRAQDFMALLRNPRLVAAANDPEVLRLLGGVDLEKAFDAALPRGEKPKSR